MEEKPKCPVCGKPMVQHVLDQVKQLNISDTVTIVGHGSEMVKAYLQDQCEYALQEQQLGTAHAVMQAAPFLSGKKGVTLLMCESTNVDRPGYTMSEKSVGEKLEKIFIEHATRRLFVATFFVCADKVAINNFLDASLL